MPDYKLAELSRTEYLRGLEALFDLWKQQLIEQGAPYQFGGGRAKVKLDKEGRGPGWYEDWQKQLDQIYSDAMTQYDLQGPSANLPYYDFISQWQTRKKWGEEYTKEKGLAQEMSSQQFRDYLQRYRAGRQYEGALAEYGWREKQEEEAREQIDLQNMLNNIEAGRRWQEAQREGLASQRAVARWGAGQQTEAMNRNLSGAEKNRIYEQARQSILASTKGKPIQWIQHEEARIAPSRMAGGMGTPWERLQSLSEEAKQSSERVKEIFARAKNPEDTLTWHGIIDPHTTEELIASQTLMGDTEIQNMFKEAQSGGGGWELGGWRSKATPGGGKSGLEGYGAPPPAKPYGVETPEWLKRYVTGLTGKYLPGTGTLPRVNPEDRPQALIPSGQSWNWLSPERRQKWAGYVDWAGQKPENLLGSMSQMIPKAPSLGRGWSAARQRA